MINCSIKKQKPYLHGKPEKYYVIEGFMALNKQNSLFLFSNFFYKKRAA
jgi:predicted transcriptional regulator